MGFSYLWNFQSRNSKGCSFAIGQFWFPEVQLCKLIYYSPYTHSCQQLPWKYCPWVASEVYLHHRHREKLFRTIKPIYLTMLSIHIKLNIEAKQCITHMVILVWLHCSGMTFSARKRGRHRKSHIAKPVSFNIVEIAFRPGSHAWQSFNRIRYHRRLRNTFLECCLTSQCND